MSLPELRVFDDAGALVAALLEAVCTEAASAISARGEFQLVLAGGRTPQVARYAMASATFGSKACGVGDVPGRATEASGERAIPAIILETRLSAAWTLGGR